MLAEKEKKPDREMEEFERQKAFARALFPYQEAKIYKFKAVKDGQESTGYVRAKTRDTAVKGLLENGYSVTEVVETTVEASQTAPLVLNPMAVQDAVAIFTRQLLVLYRSGVPLNRAVSILFVQTEEKHLKAALASMYMDMVKGTSFTNSLRRHPHVFGQDFIAMIDAGEKSGELSTVLERLADLMEKNMATMKKITAALTYPAIVLVFSLGVQYIIFKWVLPQFMEVFKSLDAEMPTLTIMILQLVKFMQSGWFWVVSAVTALGLGYGIFQTLKEPHIRFLVDGFMLKIPQIGKIIRRVVFIKSFRVFATMISSGVIISKALKNVSLVSDNQVYRSAYERMIKWVEKGDSLPECFDRAKPLFPLIVRQMIHVGDETGEPEVVLNLLADFYEAELDLALETISSLIEPVMISVMGLVVGVVVLAIFLPIYNLMNKLL